MIARPFATVGTGFVAALLVLNLIEGSLWPVAVSAAGCLVISCCARRLKNRGVLCVTLLSALAASAFFSLNEQYVYSPVAELAGSVRQIRARIVSLPEKSENGWFYTLESIEVDGRTAEHKISLFVREQLDAQPYDTVEFKAELYRVDGEENQSESYYKARKIFLQCFWHSPIKVICSEEKPLGFYLLRVKAYISQRLYSLMENDAAAVAVGMLTGNKSGMSESARLNFSAAGMSHILAVSGLHMSIIVMGLYKLLVMHMRRFSWLAGLICIFVSAAYAGVSGFSVSAVRSAIMITLMLLAKTLDRRADSLNSLGLAAFAITLHNPYSVLDWSFMLSFSATLGIILCSENMGAVLKRTGDRIPIRALRSVTVKLLSVVFISTVATLACLPVTLFFVGQVSLVFLPANLLTVLAVPVTLISAASALVPLDTLSQLSAFVCAKSGGFVLEVSQRLAGLEYASVSTDSAVLRVSFVAAAVCVLVARVTLTDKKKFTKACVAVAVFTAALNILFAII